MNKLCVILCLILGMTAPFAATVRVFKNEQYYIALTDELCQNTPFFKFHTTKNNKPQFEGCWYMHGSNVIMMEKDGETVVVPYQAFSLPEGA